ncbi:hypothetical protein MTO96_003061 [Rhipicephalus appendiculatus]
MVSCWAGGPGPAEGCGGEVPSPESGDTVYVCEVLAVVDAGTPALALTVEETTIQLAPPKSRGFMALEGPAVADAGRPVVTCTTDVATMQLAPPECRNFMALLGEGPAVADAGTLAVEFTTEAATMQLGAFFRHLRL